MTERVENDDVVDASPEVGRELLPERPQDILVRRCLVRGVVRMHERHVRRYREVPRHPGICSSGGRCNRNYAERKVTPTLLGKRCRKAAGGVQVAIVQCKRVTLARHKWIFL